MSFIRRSQIRLPGAHYPYRLKCDRQHPCTGCSKRGDAVSCNYSNASRDEHNAPRRTGGPKDSEAQLRLQKLEKMVTSLMQTTRNGSENGANEASAGCRTFDQSLNRLSIHNSAQSSETAPGGHLSINDSETNYLGATHWEAILENVRGPVVHEAPNQQLTPLDSRHSRRSGTRHGWQQGGIANCSCR